MYRSFDIAIYLCVCDNMYDHIYIYIYVYIHMCVCKEEFEHAYDHARVNEACASAYTLIVHVFVSFCAYMLYTRMHIVTYLRRKAYLVWWQVYRCARTQSRMYVSMYIFTHACMNVFLFKPACAFDVGFMFCRWIAHAWLFLGMCMHTRIWISIYIYICKG